jgi:TPR repeat protein
LVLVLTACARGEASGASEFVLDPEALAAKSREGLAGDALAARQVALHYDMGAIDMVKAKQWWRVAAKDGDAVSMSNLAQLLSQEGTAKSCAEALAWLDKAIAISTPEAASKLRLRSTLDEINATRCRAPAR